MAVSPNYPNIFDPANCSLISQLIPPGPKQFIFDFLNGQAFRNPIALAANVLQDKFGVNIDKIDDTIARFGNDLGLGVSGPLQDLNGALRFANEEMGAFISHTSRLSGVETSDILPNLEQIIGVMSAYNSIKDALKDPGQLLEDNFSNAFSSLNPQIVGPLFENFGQNMNAISSVLIEIEAQLQAGGLDDTAEMVGRIRQLTDNISSLTANIQTLINGDISAFALALAFVERYALGNTIISTVLTDPCFGGQLMKNLILQDGFSKSMDEIAETNGVKIEGSPIDLLDFVPSLKPSSGLTFSPIPPGTVIPGRGSI